MYSSILTVANYLFPLIVFPYVSRILGVEGIGAVNFIDSIVNYYILFSSMGISFAGIRAVATSNGDEVALTKSFSSLLALNAIFTCALILAYIPLFFVQKLAEYRALLFFGVFKFFFNFLLIEWLYKGLENFRFVTIRSVAIKTIYTVLVLFVVRSKSDIQLYYLLSAGMIAANAIVNCIYSKNFVHFSFSSVSLSEYITPFLVMGIYTILTSMYTSFNVTYLGLVTDEVQVGYYASATKIYGLILSFFTAFTGVMLPRMTATLEEGDNERFKSYFHKSVDLLLCFSIPCIVLFSFSASDVVGIISGQGFEGAVAPMVITMPLLFIIGYEQILVYQILMPLNKDKMIFRNSLIGAVVGISLNILLVNKFRCVGSACVWIICEIIVLVLSQKCVSKVVDLNFPLSKLLKNIATYLPLCGLMLIIRDISFPNIFLSFLSYCFLTGVYFFVVQYFILKNEILVSLITKSLVYIFKMKE